MTEFFDRDWFIVVAVGDVEGGLQHPAEERSDSGPDAEVLEAWGKATGDPDAASVLPHWLVNLAGPSQAMDAAVAAPRR